MVQITARLVLLISLSLCSVNAQEGSSCTLPGGSAQSTCIRIHYCDSLWTIVKNYGGNPPADERERINLHSCGKNVVCCPDNASQSPVTQSPVTQKVTIETNNPPIDLNAVKNHRNINLINLRCGSSSNDRIIGGNVSAVNEFPWMALLQFKSRLGDELSFNCGGALISSYYVLTAAHCVNRDLVAVRLGEHTISTERDCNADGICTDPVQDIPVEKAIKHPLYNSSKKRNDIALLRLRSPADTTRKNVKTICLPTEEDNQIDQIEEQAREKMLIAGWGKVESGIASDVLLKAFVPYLTNSECSNRFASYGTQIYETYLCAGGKKDTKKTDTCSGDSGGPIQSFGAVNNKPRMILYGVVSVGVKCLDAGVNFPGIYTNVAYYLKWILDSMT